MPSPLLSPSVWEHPREDLPDHPIQGSIVPPRPPTRFPSFVALPEAEIILSSLLCLYLHSHPRVEALLAHHPTAWNQARIGCHND